MRIAIIGVSVEMMLSSPLATGRGAIEEYRADDMRAADLWMIRGMLARLDEDADCEAVPLCWATALPGGAMTADAYATVKATTLRLLGEQGPFDGVLAVNHGALEVEGLGRDADSDFICAVRQAVGPDVPLGVALDLHGDMTPELLAAATVFSVLRTAPHRDDPETGYRAADQLLSVIRRGLKPKKAAVRIPMLLPGEVAVTTQEPGRRIYGSLPEYDKVPGMMEANVLVGFAWNDCPWTAVTAFAVAEEDATLARDQALRLAHTIWESREDFTLRMETAGVEEGIRKALETADGPVFLTDSGDNTTAGAAGDLTLVLQTALDVAGTEDIVVAGITAPETVARLREAGTGSTVGIDLGAEHLSRPKTARRVQAVVEDAGAQLELGGFQPYRSREGAWARVRIGGVTATFHADPIGITTPAHFRAMGIEPTAHAVYAVKLGYLHPQLEDIARRHILLTSDGTSQLDLTRLEWTRLPRPAWPLDGDFEWTPESAVYGDDA